MLIHEIYRQCAAMLCRDFEVTIDGITATQRLADATAFFVSVPVTGNYSTIHVVTARHASYGPSWLRINYKAEHVADGRTGYIDVPVDPAAWHRHDRTDVAVASFALPPTVNASTLDWQHIPLDGIATSEFESELGLGDDVFFVSLFTPSPGVNRFEPIVRFGNISRLPHEKVLIEMEPGTKTRVKAYLVEARSWGGHSGAPAFAYMDPDRRKPAGTRSITPRLPPVLMGLVSGHFPITPTIRLRDSLGSIEGTANSGIAAVIPGQAIRDLLTTKELLDMREKAKRAIEDLGENAVETDSALPPAFTRDDFLRDLTKVTEKDGPQTPESDI